MANLLKMGYYWIVKYILFMTLVLLIVFYNIATILLTALMYYWQKMYSLSAL